MADGYTIEKTFLDITEINGITAGGTNKYTATATQTNGTINNTLTGGAVVREVTSIEIITASNSSGVFEDLREVQPVLDGGLYAHYINLPGYGPILFSPVREKVYGGMSMFVPLGVPLWQCVKQKLPNMPIQNTTLKFAVGLGMNTSSVYGVSATSAGGSGYRIIMKGYEYTAADLAVLAPGWSNDVYVQTRQRSEMNMAPLAFTFAPGGPLSLDTFTSYPGGPAQNGPKVNPYVHFAYNAQASQSQNPYGFTNNGNIAGSQNNAVEDDYQDLGIPQSNVALIVRGFGARGVDVPPGTPSSPNGGITYPNAPGQPGANLSRAGWIIDGNYLPEVNGTQGIFLTESPTSGVNPLTFGKMRPYVPLDGVFRPIPRFAGELLIYQNQAVPFVGANGTAGIPAFSVAVAYNGVLVEQ